LEDMWRISAMAKLQSSGLQTLWGMLNILGSLLGKRNV